MKFFIYLLWVAFFCLSGLSQATTNQGSCDLDATGAIKASSYTEDSFYEDKSCYTGGIQSWIETTYKMGLCTSAPTIGNEVTGTVSDFSACTWIMDTPNGQAIDIASANLAFSGVSLPPQGTYSHLVIIASNLTTRKAFVKFEKDVQGKDGSTGKICYTNGTRITSAGIRGPYFGETSIKDQTDPTFNALASNVQSYLAATCGDTNNAVPYVQDSQYYQGETEDNHIRGTETIATGTFEWAQVKGSLSNLSSLMSPVIPNPPPKNVGVTYSVTVFPKTITILENAPRGNLTCSTSGFNLHTNLTQGNTVNVYSSGASKSVYNPASDTFVVLNLKMGPADFFLTTEEQCF